MGENAYVINGRPKIKKINLYRMKAELLAYMYILFALGLIAYVEYRLYTLVLEKESTLIWKQPGPPYSKLLLPKMAFPTHPLRHDPSLHFRQDITNM